MVHQQRYRPVDPDRVSWLEKEIMNQSSDFYQPICAMLIGCTKNEFEEERGSDSDKV